MKVYWRSGCIAPRSLDLGIRWRERAPGTHWIRGWVGPSAGLDTVVKEKFPAPGETRTSDHPAHSSALFHLALPAPEVNTDKTQILVYGLPSSPKCMTKSQFTDG
jgi:hypothetical protein